MTASDTQERRRDIEPMSMPNFLPYAKVTSRIGAILVHVFPRRAASLTAGRLSASPSRLETLLIAGLVRTHRRRGTLDALTAMHDWYWTNAPAVRFHEFSEKRFQRFFLENHVAIVPPLRAALASGSVPYSTLCEIGCGSGRILQYLADSLNEIPRFVGLDLSPEQVARNRARYTGRPMEFAAADGAAWIAEHAKPGWVYLTCGGVLEYFPRQKLLALFSTIAATLAPALFVLVEPLSDEQTLDGNGDSTPFGAENTFSHDYVGLLRAARYELLHRSEQRFDNQRWLLVVARTP